MKKNIAYKVAKNISNLPDGFVTEHMETDEDAVEGFLVVPREAFPELMANNVALMASFNKEAAARSPNKTSGAAITGTNIPPQSSPDDALFQQFLAWKASQGGSS